MDFKRDLKQKIHNINENLEAYLKEVHPPTLKEAMCYSLLAGGKRLRPLLLLSAYEAEARPESSERPPLAFACALEMIHSYSLIHDDLPAMDDDDFRRGKPTNHKLYGEATAILAGDGLLNKAYEIMAEYCAANLEPRFVQAMAVIAEAAGSNGMVGGQVADMLSQEEVSDRTGKSPGGEAGFAEGKTSDRTGKSPGGEAGFAEGKTSEEALIYIHEHKTGALLTASVTAGAILGGASAQRLEQYTLAGKKLGLSFQIKDDILNVTGNPAVLGKPVKSDEKNKKLTYVSFYGLEKAEKDFETFSQEALTILQKICPSDSFLIELIKTIAERVK